MNITIGGFESLKRVKLNDLARVNYLVGEMHLANQVL